MSELMELVTEHLRSLGYAVDQHEEGLRAMHESELGMHVREFADGVLLTAFFPMKGDEAERFEFVNALNRDALMIRCVVDPDGDFAMEGWFPGPYQRATFDCFVNVWRHDVSQAILNEATPRFVQ